MRDGGAAFMAAADLAFRKMHAMRQHGAFADQTVMIVDVEVILPLGEELGGPFGLAAIFGNMRLHQYARMLAPEAACRLELGRRARSGKARRDRVECAAA